jgi:predicted small integral membrane protein
VHALRRLGSLDTAATVFTLITALQMTLIVLGNLTDYATNKDFVVHVLAMDTTFRSPNLMWRAITSPGLDTVAYAGIIAWETISALVLIAAAIRWLTPNRTQARELARQLSTIGWLMWIVLFGGGFIAVGGEYFAMWESDKWNGLRPALQNLTIAGIGLVLVHLRPGSAHRAGIGAADGVEEHPA